MRKVAVLCDIHGNRPALDAVLAEVRAAAPDAVVVGGDVVAGPMPAEVLDDLLGLEVPVRWVRGNADRTVLQPPEEHQFAELERQLAELDRWVASRLGDERLHLLARFEQTVEIDVDGLGRVCFCHGTPRSDEEIVTRVTSDERLLAVLAGVEADVVVGGHTHQQFDRRVGRLRLVNAGSVGMPYDLRRTEYDVGRAVAELRATGMPDIDELLLRDSLLEPLEPQEVAAFFEERA